MIVLDSPCRINAIVAWSLGGIDFGVLLGIVARWAFHKGQSDQRAAE